MAKKGVKDNAFKNQTTILSSVFGNQCKFVGENAFNGCYNLSQINDDNVIESIGSYAFYECKKLSQISLSVCSEIGESAFSNCSNLKEVYINNPYNIFCELKDKYVFCDSDDNDSYDKYNGSIKFYFKADGFEKYKSDSNWSYYIENMFMILQDNQIAYRTSDGKLININDTTNIKKHNYGFIEFYTDVTSINKGIFNGSNLIHIDIPLKCTEIGDYAFENCKLLKSFKIPEHITKLGEGIFAGCENLDEFEGKFVTYNEKAIVCENKLICVLPKTENKIYKISDIDSNITILGKSCFHGCENMIVIDIPSNITSIGDNAFAGCKNLCEVHFNSDIPPTLGNDVFKDCLPSNSAPKDFKIFVPGNSVDTYKEQYKDLEKYIYPIEDGYEVFVVSDYGTIEVKVGDSEENGNNEIMGVKLKREN